MGCPQCESMNLTPTMNMNESACLDCGCEFKTGENRVTIYEVGTYGRFVESVFHEIDQKIFDPSVTAALKSRVPGYLNEGARSLKNLISDLIEDADHLHNQYLAGLKEKEEFIAVMEAIKRLYSWAKLNEQSDIIPEGYYDDEDDEGGVDLDAIMGMGGEDDEEMPAPEDDYDDQDAALAAAGIDEEGEVDLDAIMGMGGEEEEEMPQPEDDLEDQDAALAAAGIDEAATPEEKEIINKAIQDIKTDKLQVQDVLPTIPEHLRDDVLAMLRKEESCGAEPISMEKEPGIPPSTDIAVDRIKDAAEEIAAAAADLETEVPDEDDLENGVTMVAPMANMGLGGGYIAEDFAFSVGDKVYVDNVSETCEIVEINESKITVADQSGNLTTVDMSDPYRETDIQFSREEYSDIVMERSQASANTLKERYLAMMDQFDSPDDNLALNFSATTLSESQSVEEIEEETEEVEEGFNSNWNQEPEIAPEVKSSYPSKLTKNMAKKGAVGGESEEKDGEVLEEGTDDTGMGMDSNTGMGDDVDEGGVEAAEKKHDKDGEVTSSVEVADDESDGIDFPDVGDGTGVEELHEQKRQKLREQLAAQLSEESTDPDVNEIISLITNTHDWWVGAQVALDEGGIDGLHDYIMSIVGEMNVDQTDIQSTAYYAARELAQYPDQYFEQETANLPGELNDPIDPEDEAEGARPMKVIRTSYEKWSPEDIEAGDTDDKGWYDEDGEVFSSTEEAIEWLTSKGHLEPSSSSFHSGIWYTEYDAEDDFEGGTTTNYSYHLDGFDDEEQRAIYNGVTGMSENIDGTEMHQDKIEELKADLEESVIGDHFHGTDGVPKPFPFTQDPTNSANEAEKEAYMDKHTCDKDKTVPTEDTTTALQEAALKGLRVNDVINRGNDFKTQWTVTKIDRNPAKVHLQAGLKRGVMDPLKESFQYIDGVVLGYERTLEGVAASKETWEQIEESIENYEDTPKGFEYIKESAKFEEAEEKEEVETEELPVLSKNDLYRYVKESELHRERRTETLQGLVSKFGNDVEEMERILDDVTLSESDQTIDEQYGIFEASELDTEFALKAAWAEMEETFEIKDKGGNPRTDNSEKAVATDLDGGDDLKINFNENRQWFNL